MAFKPLDSAVYADGRPLSSFALKTVERNLRDVHGSRLRAHTWSRPINQAPRLYAYTPTIVSIPFLWKPSKGLLELEVRLRHRPQAQTSDGFAIGAGLVRLRDWLEDPKNPAVDDTATITNASNGSTITTTLTITEDAINRGGGLDDWALVWITMVSDRGTWQDLENGGKDPHLVPLFQNRWGFVVGPNDEYSSAATPPHALRLYDTSASEVFGQEYMVLRAGPWVSDTQILTYPFQPRDLTNLQLASDPIFNPAEDKLQFAELGYTDLLAVEIRETDVDLRQSHDSALDAGRPPSSPRVFGPLYGGGEELWRTRTRLFHAGPSTNPSVEDSDISGRMLNRVSNRVELTTSWATVARWQAWENDQFDNAGTTYERNLYRVGALFTLQHYEGQNRPDRPQDIKFRLVVEQNLLDTISETYTLEDVPSLPWRVDAPEQSNHLAYLDGLSLLFTPSNPAAHALRGLPPGGAWRDAAANFIELSVFASDALSAGRIEIELQAALVQSADSDGFDGYNGGRWISLHTTHVETPAETALSTDYAVEV